MKKHFNITIKALVQGVYYRGATKMMAEELGIYGFVRNEPNGDVYAEAEGEEGKLQEFIKWCKRGPEMAEVKEVIVKEGEEKNYSGFAIWR